MFSSEMSKDLKTLVWIIAVLFGLWQMGAVAHLMLEEHEIDKDTGEPTHGDHGSPSHDSCFALKFLTSAHTDVLDTFATQSISENAEEHSIVAHEIVLPCGRELYRLSPSNSPPKRS